MQPLAPPTPSPHLAPEGTRDARRIQWQPDSESQDEDRVVVEEPLEIRLGSVPLAVLMRTPGQDEELVTGFVVTEQIVASLEQVQRVAHCSVGEHSENIMIVYPAEGAELDPKHLSRNLYTTSSCGVCGKRSLDQALLAAPPLSTAQEFDRSLLSAAPEKLRKFQSLFAQTGAIHAAGLMDEAGDLVVVREDIGRHNAVDKVIGNQLAKGNPMNQRALIVSGRTSFEIVQKALAARISYVVSVGGVSSLAIDLAEEAGITLMGFATSTRLSLY